MCDRKYMYGDKSTFGSRSNGQNMPKKGQLVFLFFCIFNKGLLPTLLIFLKNYILHYIHFLPFVHFSNKKHLSALIKYRRI